VNHRRDFRACYLSQKWMTPEEVEVRCTAVSHRTEAMVPGAIAVTASLEDYRERFRSFGTWGDWIADVSRGLRQGDYTPRYHIFVIDEPLVGRATAQIAESALAAGKPVLFADTAWPEERGFAQVTGVTCVDPDSWIGAWQVVFKEPAAPPRI